MEANPINSDFASLSSVLESSSISTPDPMKEGFQDAREDTTVPQINHRQPHKLEALPPIPIGIMSKRRQRLDESSRPKNTKFAREQGQRCLRDHAKPALLSLPVELRLVILRKVLGDQKVHIHYKRGLYSDSNHSNRKTAFVQYLPQYVFCHHDAFMEDPPLRRAVESGKRYENHHDLCNLPCVSLDTKLKFAFQDQDPASYTPTRIGAPRLLPRSIVPSPESIELMYESFELRLSIFAVSRQLREEAMEVYYKTNTFSFATATFFNIFISRITDTKASLLRKVEFIYDSGDFAIRDDKKMTPPPPWKLGVSNTRILRRLANITDITIRYFNLCSITRHCLWQDSKMQEHTGLSERLRRDFGGLGRLRSVMRVNVRAYDGTVVGRTKPVLDRVCLNDIGDNFATEILRGSNAGCERGL